MSTMFISSKSLGDKLGYGWRRLYLDIGNSWVRIINPYNLKSARVPVKGFIYVQDKTDKESWGILAKVLERRVEETSSSYILKMYEQVKKNAEIHS